MDFCSYAYSSNQKSNNQHKPSSVWRSLIEERRLTSTSSKNKNAYILPLLRSCACICRKMYPVGTLEWQTKGKGTLSKTREIDSLIVFILSFHYRDGNTEGDHHDEQRYNPQTNHFLARENSRFNSLFALYRCCTSGRMHESGEFWTYNDSREFRWREFFDFGADQSTSRRMLFQRIKLFFVEDPCQNEDDDLLRVADLVLEWMISPTSVKRLWKMIWRSIPSSSTLTVELNPCVLTAFRVS